MRNYPFYSFLNPTTNFLMGKLHYTPTPPTKKKKENNLHPICTLSSKLQLTETRTYKLPKCSELPLGQIWRYFEWKMLHVSSTCVSIILKLIIYLWSEKT